MDQIQHKYVEANGVKIHTAEIETGETVVLFLHGFPEILYSWRYQMIAVAKAGYRAIAPDFRGYGLSDASQEPEKTTFKDTVHDLVSILDAFSIPKIQHTYVKVNGINIHLAEIGASGDKVVIFLHGFPEIWYSWRHQLIAAGKAGYRAIAPDFRGYGLSDAPPEPEKATFKDTINDLLAILDALTIPKVFLIAKDWGSRTAYYFTILYPERVSGIITFGVPFSPPGPAELSMKFSEGFYISRWQESGRAEADFARFDAKTIVRNVYILFSRSEIPVAVENQEIMDLVEPSTPLPPWFSEEDLQVYGDLYEKSGFRTALKVPYRSFGEAIELPDRKIETPALLIVGENDFSLKFPGRWEFIRGGNAKAFVPNLEISYISEGGHFMQEQFPDKVNELLVAFLCNHD